ELVLGGNCTFLTKARLPLIPAATVRLAPGLMRQCSNKLPPRWPLQLERQVTNEQLWLGRRVKIVDGTGLSMPDTAANQLEWPQNSGQKPGCGFPQLKVVGLFCLQSGALLQVAHDNKHHNDIMLARRFWHLLQPGEILLADRGFCSYLDIAQLVGRGVDCVM